MKNHVREEPHQRRMESYQRRIIIGNNHIREEPYQGRTITEKNNVREVISENIHVRDMLSRRATVPGTGTLPCREVPYRNWCSQLHEAVFRIRRPIAAMARDTLRHRF